jgi:outer membrane receptor protein involved in Fe transport
MKKIKLSKILFVLTLISVLPGTIISQNKSGNGGFQKTDENTCAVYGTVIDKNTRNPIEYANIVVLRIKDSTMINGTVSDKKGRFRIEKLPYGQLYVKVNFIGYSTKKIKDVLLTIDRPEKNLGVIELSTTSTNLAAVDIVSEKQSIESNLDKKVVNVDKTLFASGGTAIDIMQTIPSVSVDIDGNVGLRGSQNVTILIDGRPSIYTSLDQLPASIIDKIEIVTNPSARFDPDGTSGIINIILKKKNQAGYSGMISLTGGIYDNYSGSANFNIRYNKLSFSVGYDPRIFNISGISKYHRQSNINGITSYLDQDGTFWRRGISHNIKSGLDYFINSKNTLSFSFLYTNRHMDENDFIKYFSSDSLQNLTNYAERNTDEINRNNGKEYSLDYRRTFDKKNEELTANIYFSDNKETGNSIMTQYPYNIDLTPDGIPALQNDSTYSTGRQLTAQIDFIDPVGKGRIETGYKGNYKISDNDYYLMNYIDSTKSWENDSLASNNFVYTIMLHSAYFIYSNSVGKFKYQVGLRGEAAFTDADQRTTDQVFTKNYFNAFPSAHIRYDFNDNNSLQLSYSRRVNRPRGRQLNPFTNYTDPMNLSAGNPYLGPEFTNAVELEYILGWKDMTLNPTLFYRQTDNMISRIVTLNSDGTTFSTYQNLKSGVSYGVEMIYTQKVAKWFKFNTNLSLFKQKINGSVLTNEDADESFSWTGKLTTTFTPLKNFDIQAMFNYSSPVVTAQGGFGGGGQGMMQENYSCDLAAKKDFFKGKFSVSLRASDIFKTQKYNLEIIGSDFTSNTLRQRNSRMVYLTLTYKINGGIKQRSKKNSDDNNELDF